MGTDSLRRADPKGFDHTSLDAHELLVKCHTLEECNASEDRTKHQEEAIKHCEAVLAFASPDYAFADYRLKLGILFSDREEGELQLNVERARSVLAGCLTLSLDARADENHPIALWQQLGHVYRWQSGWRVANERTESLELSIQYYRKAFEEWDEWWTEEDLDTRDMFAIASGLAMVSAKAINHSSVEHDCLIVLIFNF
jgi:hypothetical protein